MYIVIAGGGKIGEYLASVLLGSGNDVAVIEENLQTADHLSIVLEGRYLVIHGDGCDSKYQEDAGIRKADVFVATTGQDDDNLVSCEIAQRVFNVPRCIARVNNPKNLRIFREVGIESVSSTTLIANLIEEETLLGSVSVASSLTHGNVVLTEITVPRMRYHSNEAGILAESVPMPENSLIAAVSPKDDDNVEVVGEETVLYPGDKAIVVADTEVLDEVRSLFKGLSAPAALGSGGLPAAGTLPTLLLSLARRAQLLEGLGRGVGAGAVAQRDHLHGVAGLHLAVLQRHEEHALAGEDAVAGQVVDGALRVAHLADLGELQERAAHAHAGAQRQRQEVDTLGGDVLREVALGHVEAHGLRLLDGLPCQKRHLPVPVAGMRVARHAAVRLDGGTARTRRLPAALAPRRVHRPHAALPAFLHLARPSLECLVFL